MGKTPTGKGRIKKFIMCVYRFLKKFSQMRLVVPESAFPIIRCLEHFRDIKDG